MPRQAQRRAVHKRLRAVATQRSAALSTADRYMRRVARPTRTDGDPLLASLRRWTAAPRVKAASDAPAATVRTLLLPSVHAVLSHRAWSVGAPKVLRPKRKTTLQVYAHFPRLSIYLSHRLSTGSPPGGVTWPKARCTRGCKTVCPLSRLSLLN